MDWNRNSWYGLIGVLLVFVVAVVVYEQFLAEGAPTAYREFAQSADERRFANVEVERVEWTHNPNSHLLDPLQTEVHAGRIYVWDQGEMKLKVFDLNGRLVTTIGRGRGKAPGELVSLMDFFVRDGRVWILDGHERRISIFDATDGTYVKQILLKPDGTPNRIASLEESLIIRQLAPTELFLEVDTTGEVIGRFGAMEDFMDRFDERNPLAFTGDLMTTERAAVFGARSASYIHYFNAEGDMIRTVRTIDGQPYGGPEGVKGEGGTRFSAPKPPIRYHVFTIQGDTLKINAADYENRRAVIDYYTIEGKYLESVLVPEPVTLAYPHRGMIITSHHAKLTKYRIVR